MSIKDALGNDIVFGNLYGYSTSSNGFTEVTIGIALKATPKGFVTIRPQIKRGAIYNDEPTPKPIGKATTVKPMILFPIALI